MGSYELIDAALPVVELVARWVRCLGILASGYLAIYLMARPEPDDRH